jgi:mannose-6-phosphate isomerase-like protein (cupin superfamily)
MGFQMHPIYQGPAPSVSEFECHFSTLQAGEMPHTPHHHREEELIILMSGQLVVIRVDPDTGEHTEHPVAQGEMVYHASESIHTLRSEGPGPARYLILKWGGAATPGPQTVFPSKTVPYEQSFAGHAQSAEGFTSTVVFESPTRYLRKLHCHVSTVQPGAGYDAHDDNYDVAIVLLKGTVETAEQRVEAPSVIYYSADHPSPTGPGASMRDPAAPGAAASSGVRVRARTSVCSSRVLMYPLRVGDV